MGIHTHSLDSEAHCHLANLFVNIFKIVLIILGKLVLR